MANFNRVFLIGNLTRDPELKYVPGGTAVSNLRLAVNNRYRDKNGEYKDVACFITVVVWGRQAENCNQYLNKGSAVFVEGTLQSRSWQTSDGQKRNVIEVRANRVQFLGKPSGASSAKDTSDDEEVIYDEGGSEERGPSGSQDDEVPF